MANNPDGRYDKPSYHEVPASKYLFLRGTAIHKRLFFYWTIISWFTGFIIISLMINTYLSNLWLLVPSLIFVVATILIVLWDKRNRRKRGVKR